MQFHILKCRYQDKTHAWLCTHSGVWQVEDEETVQTKAWNYLFEKAKVRGLVEGELAHPLWNAYKRAIKDADLDTSVLKLTILSNFGHGSYTNGDKLFTRREYLQKYLERQNDDWYSELADNIAFDRHLWGEHLTPNDLDALFSDFIEADTIARRGRFVPHWDWKCGNFRLATMLVVKRDLSKIVFKIELFWSRGY